MTGMFQNFDPQLLNDAQFKEDAVREVIILPILTRLGYHPSGDTRVIRSKSLAHPFIYVGTGKHPVTLVPDYTLLHEEKPILVLDAKSPTENILSRKNVEQVYSYAIHPEIRSKHFSICNGKTLAVFSVDEPKPLIVIPFADFETKWESVERFMSPRFLLQPALRKYAPDFGFKIQMMGIKPDTTIIMYAVRLGMFARISDTLMTATSNCILADEAHMVSFDFPHVFLQSIVAGLPKSLSDGFVGALSAYPFQADAGLVIEVDLKLRMGEVTQGKSENFIPMIITEILASRFNPDPLPNKQREDLPGGIFELRKAFKIISPDNSQSREAPSSE